MPDIYDVLGLKRDATPKEIQVAYREQAMRWHPDRNRAPEATDRMKEVNSAYDILSSDSLRNAYDIEHGYKAPPPPPMPTEAGFNTKTWTWTPPPKPDADKYNFKDEGVFLGGVRFVWPRRSDWSVEEDEREREFDEAIDILLETLEDSELKRGDPTDDPGTDSQTGDEVLWRSTLIYVPDTEDHASIESFPAEVPWLDIEVKEVDPTNNQDKWELEQLGIEHPAPGSKIYRVGQKFTTDYIDFEDPEMAGDYQWFDEDWRQEEFIRKLDQMLENSGLEYEYTLGDVDQYSDSRAGTTLVEAFLYFPETADQETLQDLASKLSERGQYSEGYLYVHSGSNELLRKASRNELNAGDKATFESAHEEWRDESGYDDDDFASDDFQDASWTTADTSEPYEDQPDDDEMAAVAQEFGPMDEPVEADVSDVTQPPPSPFSARPIINEVVVPPPPESGQYSFFDEDDNMSDFGRRRRNTL